MDDSPKVKYVEPISFDVDIVEVLPQETEKIPGIDATAPKWETLPAEHSVLPPIADVFSLPEYSKIRLLIKKAVNLDKRLAVICNEEKYSKNLIAAINRYLDAETDRLLRTIPIDDLNKEKKGIRVSALRKAGCYTMYDIVNVSYKNLTNIYGIGPDSAKKIIAVTRKYRDKLRNNSIKFRESNSSEFRGLIEAIYKKLNSVPIIRKSRSLYEKSHDELISAVKTASTAKNPIRRLFAKDEIKMKIPDAVNILNDMVNGWYEDEFNAIYYELKAIESADSKTWLNDYHSNKEEYIKAVTKKSE